MTVVQVFARPPVEGKVKTRLIPDIGAPNAARVYRYCLDYTLKLVAHSGLENQVWLSEHTKNPIFNTTYRLQQGSDLGQRMFQAINTQITDCSSRDQGSAILIGSDCLDLTIDHLYQSRDALIVYDLVLLPAFDGGFALIGCRKIDARLFQGVAWGTNQVLNQTLENAKALDYHVFLFNPVRDIDTRTDLNHYPELISLIK